MSAAFPKSQPTNQIGRVYNGPDDRIGHVPTADETKIILNQEKVKGHDFLGTVLNFTNGNQKIGKQTIKM